MRILNNPYVPETNPRSPFSNHFFSDPQYGPNLVQVLLPASNRPPEFWIRHIETHGQAVGSRPDFHGRLSLDTSHRNAHHTVNGFIGQSLDK